MNLSFKRTQKKVTVMTHGSYDLIHPGHIAHLRYCKSLGDVLIVGVGSDSLTKFRKGPIRPVQPIQDRLEVIRAIRYVDEAFEVPNTHNDLQVNLMDSIEKVRPDIFVTSYPRMRELYGDKLSELKVKLVISQEFKGGTTSTIIDKILNGHEATA